MAHVEPVYKEIRSEESFSFDEDGHVASPPSPSPSRRCDFSTITLLITTVIFGLLSLYLSLKPNVFCISTRGPYTFKDGYETEWGPAKESIEMQEVTYTSRFRYNATDNSYYREFDPASPQYVGTPTPEIDKAWMDLLAGQYLVFNESEAMELDDPISIKGYYLGEVEVMHSLHCLNAIRKELYREYYSVHDEHRLPEDLRVVHVEHCLEQLRQNIQCAGDLTPVLLHPYGKAPHMTFIGTPQAHTCRNWDSFRQWWTKRGHTHGRINSGGT